MKSMDGHIRLASCLICGMLLATGQIPVFTTTWQTVVNNGDPVPADPCSRLFNSYNPPSVNATGLVVFRARSRGGGTCGEGAHGVFQRQSPAGVLQRILDRSTTVPFPNNLGTQFVEPPSFPRIDIWSNTVATRANHPPVWRYLLANGSETRAGTSGIYTTPGGVLVTGASKLGGVPAYPIYAVPGAVANTPFDVFPGAPSVANPSSIVFKGNYRELGAARTGVYYRNLLPSAAGGGSSVQLIGNSKETRIPGTSLIFGSLAPPSAAMDQAVFSGFDNESNPSAGGIYLVDRLIPRPPFKTLVAIGSPVPDEPASTGFRWLGEALSFDGRMVAFWGAWGSETRRLRLWCPSEGNKVRVAYCWNMYPYGHYVNVPVHQGIFVHDIQTRITRTVAKTGAAFQDFLFWNFSGMVPGMEGGDESDSDDGELARWRSATFVAVSGLGATSRTVFKAQATSGKIGIYGLDLPGNRDIFTVLDTGYTGQSVDPEAPFGSTIVELGLERDGLRNGMLVINASMGIPGLSEPGWAGIYLAVLPRLP